MPKSNVGSTVFARNEPRYEPESDHQVPSSAQVLIGEGPGAALRVLDDDLQKGQVLPVEFRTSASEPPSRLREMDADVTERHRPDEARGTLEAKTLLAQKLDSLALMAGGIAHGFNNLMAVVLMHADLARRSLPPDSSVREDLFEIETASRMAASLCRQMLSFAGQGRMNPKPLNLSQMMSAMEGLLCSSISPRIDFICDYAETLPPVDGDLEQLQQVVLNLVVNASEAIGEKLGTLTVSTGVVQCDDEFFRRCFLVGEQVMAPHVYLRVSDSGIGMSADMQLRIFDPFFSTKFTGRGLGLASVLGIVRAHRGSICLDSELGRGTEFTLVFPISRMRTTRTPIKTEPVTFQGTGTILVVDDELPLRRVVARLLESFGFDVLLAGDGYEALDVFRQNASQISAVVLDLKLPQLDGEETFRELRLLRPDVPVIVSTGYGNQAKLRHLEEIGVDAILEKPFNMEQLGATVCRIVASAAPRETQGAAPS